MESESGGVLSEIAWFRQLSFEDMTMLQGLPNWNVEVNEVSAGVYKGKAVHVLGSQIELMGTDADKLITEIRTAASRMELQIEEKISGRKP